MRLAQDILENYIGVEEDEEDAAGESRRSLKPTLYGVFLILRPASLGPSEFSFPANPGPSSGYNFDGGDASM
jgi:hypothetical protein